MREIINIYIGQSGVQIGSEIWKLFCQEHEIDYSGKKIYSETTLLEENLKSFFSEIQEEKYVPRSIFIDLDSMTIDEIRKGSLKNLFNAQTLISGKEDASHIFSRGAYSVGKNLIDISMNQISKLARECENLQGFIIHASTNGGTSAGFGDLILQNLQNDYGSKKAKISSVVIPSKQISSSIVEPYNSVLGLHSLNQNCDANIVFQNQALYGICCDQLDLEYASYTHINKLIAQTISSLTSSIRFQGALNVSLHDFLINIIPYSRLNLIIPSYAPFSNSESIQDQDISVNQITKSIFQNSNCYVDCDFRNGTFLSCTYALRGDVIPKQILDSIYVEKYKKTIKFVDWCPTGFKLGVSTLKPVNVFNNTVKTLPIDGSLFSNNAAIINTLYTISQKYDCLYSKRAYYHWFIGEGMERGEFYEARDNLASIEKDYQETIKSENQEQQIQEEF